MTNPQPTITPDYYLTNFTFLVNWVLARYEDLLNTAEKQFITQFQQVDHDSQCLLVRLCSRKGPLFRADKLQYAEIKSIPTAAKHLIAAGLMEENPRIDMVELANQLTKIELLALFPEPLRPHKNARKEELIEVLCELYPEAKTWHEWTHNSLGQVYRVDAQGIISTLLLLFFGNAYQNLTEFVLQDLGLFRYEQYTIDHQHRIFKSRDEIEQYQHLVYLREQAEIAEELEDILDLIEQLPPLNLLVETNSQKSAAIHRRRAALCNHLAYELERREQHDLALLLYQQSHLPPARERQIRLFEKQKDYASAWNLLNELLEAPANEHERQIAERMAPRLAKKLGHAFTKTQPVDIIEERHTLPQLQDEDGNPLLVEDIVLLHLDDPEAPCFYVENLLINGLFGLWLWPEIFRGIDGAFANPLQAAPLDMYSEDFVSKRPGINDLWQLFEKGKHTKHIQTIWRNKHGITNHFVNWEYIDKELLDIALKCIPAQDLKVIFRRLLFDIHSNRSGFPDLIQFLPNEPNGKNYRLIEVKGPGDRLQDNQQRWLNYFAAHDIPAEVWYVRWQ